MKQLWISCPKFTVQVDVGDDNRVVEAAPVVRRFIGQNIDNLLYWLRGFGKVEVSAI